MFKLVLLAGSKAEQSDVCWNSYPQMPIYFWVRFWTLTGGCTFIVLWLINLMIPTLPCNVIHVGWHVRVLRKEAVCSAGGAKLSGMQEVLQEVSSISGSIEVRAVVVWQLMTPVIFSEVLHNRVISEWLFYKVTFEPWLWLLDLRIGS